MRRYDTAYTVVCKIVILYNAMMHYEKGFIIRNYLTLCDITRYVTLTLCDITRYVTLHVM